MFLKTLREDIQTVFTKDPSVKSTLEVLLCYPGLHAIWSHRIAHWFYQKGLYTVARLISHISRHITGIEIHPGARIGRRFFIDHGMGIVIGETSEISDDVLMYQGTVLGGTTLEKKKRHPALGNDVVVGAGAILLGPIKVGNGARIAAGSVVLTDVPPNAIVVGVPGRIGLGFSTKEIQYLEHNKLPDPIADTIRFVMNEFGILEARIKKIESLEGIISQIDDKIEEQKKEIGKMFISNNQEVFEQGDGI
ncbi:MAG: serine O-acetyltransferase [Planctomycetota bacterium]|nr:serine O-acetyltransferase [Planctomycetota bacterium]MDI6786954.1 serine O-acetyltransferase [Planctomycetota bacterium]